MLNWFGKKKSATPAAPRLADSIAQLREAQLMLDKREAHLEKQIQLCKQQAAEKLKQKDQKAALFLLKRSKMFEQQIQSIYGKKSNIDVQIMALESAASNREVFQVMKSGKDALTKASAEVDIDKVSDVMEDITESIQMSEEVNEALSQQIGPQMDEDELHAELAEMESSLVDQQVLQAPQVPVTATTSKSPMKALSTTTTTNASTLQQNKNPTVIHTAESHPDSSTRAITTTTHSLPTQLNPVETRTITHTTKSNNLTEKESKELKELEGMS